MDLADEQEAIRAQRARTDSSRHGTYATERSNLVHTVKERVRAQRIAALPEEDRRILALASDPQGQPFKEQAAALEKKLQVSDGDALQAATEPEKKRHAALTGDLESLEKSKRPFLRGLLATDTREPVPPTRIHFQGDHKAEKDPVSPGFLSILNPNPASLLQVPVNTNTTGRRLTLAAWIASTDNPLTARVYVNRAWQSFFGRGLVATPVRTGRSAPHAPGVARLAGR